jgi:annexin A7/11
VKFIYEAADGKDVKGESSLRFKPLRTMFTSLTKDTFEVADGDYIAEVFGFADTVINQIGFTTYKGQRKAYGPEKGIFFRYHYPHHTFVAARGSYEKFLDFLCFKVVRLP